MATEKQIAANRINGMKGGVKTAEGKAISRLNALKHGIFATALMECQSDGYFAALLDELNAELKPVGIVEQLLVDKLAVTYLRMRRCAQAETLHFEQRWHFNPANFGKFPYDEAVVAIGLYDTRLTKQFLRLLSEIDHRQKTRRSAECRAQSAERRMTAEPVALQNEEGVAKIEKEEKVKNEPNSASEPVRSNAGSVPIQRTDLDSRPPRRASLRGNDNDVGNSEPNPAPQTHGLPAEAGDRDELPAWSEDEKVKNEPNSGNGGQGNSASFPPAGVATFEKGMRREI